MPPYSLDRDAARRNGTVKSARDAIQSLRAYVENAAGFGEPDKKTIASFIRDRPSDAQRIVEYFDHSRCGLNFMPDRILTRRATKIRRVWDEFRQSREIAHAIRAYVRRHKMLVALVVAVTLLPALLAPNHPLAVYAYLFDTYCRFFVSTASAAAPSIEMRDYLVSPEQVARYRSELRETVRSTEASRLFVVVRTTDGALKQEAIRTWDSFLAPALPSAAVAWLYRKEIPFLGDEVSVWLREGAFEAEGHYHSLGGMPSKGDALAQRWSNKPEIVVSNGLVPYVYLNGILVPYSRGVTVSNRIYRAIRSSEGCLVMDTEQDLFLDREPSAAIKSYLGYLRDYRGVDIARIDAVAEETDRLYSEFEASYRDVFTRGVRASAYKSDADIYNFLAKLELLRTWAEHVDTRPDLPPR